MTSNGNTTVSKTSSIRRGKLDISNVIKDATKLSDGERFLSIEGVQASYNILSDKKKNKYVCHFSTTMHPGKP